jgi:anti-sigma B factor antagonist
MEITGIKNENKLTVVLSGRLDTNTSPELESYLRENLEGVIELVIDLSDVQYVSSAGLRVFLYAHKELAKAGGEVILAHPNVYIADVLDATGFTEILKIEN